MSKITFYIQARADGGRRTGLEVDGETVLGRFEPGGKEDFDPALLWYVDIRCQGNALSTEPEQARRWLASQSALLTAALRELAQELQVGLDTGLWPLQRKIVDAPPGVTITLVCSSLQRVASREFGQILAQIAEAFKSTLGSLGRIEAAA